MVLSLPPWSSQCHLPSLLPLSSCPPSALLLLSLLQVFLPLSMNPSFLKCSNLVCLPLSACCLSLALLPSPSFPPLTFHLASSFSASCQVIFLCFVFLLIFSFSDIVSLCIVISLHRYPAFFLRFTFSCHFPLCYFSLFPSSSEFGP